MSDNNSNDDDGDGAAPWLPFANLLTIIERSPSGIGCDVVVGRLSVKFYDVVDEFMAGCVDVCMWTVAPATSGRC